MRIRSLFAGLMLAASQAWACACFMEPGCRTPTGDAVFLGKVVSIERVQTGSTMGGKLPLYSANVTLAVSEHFRGPSTDSIVVANEQSDCAYPFKAEHEYLIFAHEYQGRLMVDKCTATRPAKMSAAIIAPRATGLRCPIYLASSARSHLR